MHMPPPSVASSSIRSNYTRLSPKGTFLLSKHDDLSHARENRLFAALPEKIQVAILDASSLRKMKLGTSLYKAGKLNEYCYFPITGIASVIAEMPEGRSAEVIVIGREGVTGFMQALGPAAPSTTCVVQLPMIALRTKRAILQSCFHANAETGRLLLEFTQFQVFTLSQLAGCNLLHDAPSRLARWLLMAQARTETAELAFTQTFLAEMLGLERSTVSVCATSLQERGAIRYSRGKIVILDRAKLEVYACSCYPAVKTLHDGLFAKQVG